MPRPNFESNEWEDGQFEPSMWQEWYGEGAQECASIFDMHLQLQARYQRAERRANAILGQDELDISSVREYIQSIYEQAEQGLLEESGITYGRDPSGRRFTNQDMSQIVHDLPKYENICPPPNEGHKSGISRFRGFIESLGKFRHLRFI